MATRFLIIGGGPAGNTAATTAARLGAEVVMVERDVIGGAAHLWDCIPSKTMIATGRRDQPDAGNRRYGARERRRRRRRRRAHRPHRRVENTMRDNTTRLLESQGVRIVHGTGRLHQAVHRRGRRAPTAAETIEFDAALVSTGSRPRIPDWCQPDGERILTTRDCYPPKIFPESITVVGSGVTGVEFVHMFSSFGSKVTLVVSRQQVLPGKDPEVAAVLEDDFLRRGVHLLKGARAESIERTDDDVTVRCDDGRVGHVHARRARHRLDPQHRRPRPRCCRGRGRPWGYVDINHHCLSNVEHIYAAGDISGKLPLSSVASMQGRKMAEHVMGGHTRSHRHLDYDKAASAIFTEPEIADVGLAEAEAFSSGRKIRVTKVPFSSTAKALINNDSQGFVKIISDPATGVVLGGSIVGRQAAELISVIAVAVTAGLKVTDLVESLLVHPALSEALGEAAEYEHARQGKRQRRAAVGPTLSSPPPACGEARLFNDGEDVAGADGVAGGDLDLLDGAGLLGVDLVLHLHRFEHHDAGTDLDRLADLDEHLHDRALHRRFDRAGGDRSAATAARTATRGLLWRSARSDGDRRRFGHPHLDVETLAVDLDRCRALDLRFGLVDVGFGGAALGFATDAGEVELFLDPLGRVGHRGEVGMPEDCQVGGNRGGNTLDDQFVERTDRAGDRRSRSVPHTMSLPTRLS